MDSSMSNTDSKSQAAAGAPKAANTNANAAKEAKAAAKAAKAQRRAAAKGDAAPSGSAEGPSGTGQRPAGAPPPGQRGTRPDAAARGQQQQQQAGGAQLAGSSQQQQQGGSGGGGRGHRQGGPAGAGSSAALSGQTAASLASANPTLLNPPASKASTSASSSSAPDLLSTIHPCPSSSQHRSQLLVTSTSRGLHPSVILLMQHLASHTLLGSSARAIATLAALRDFIADYKTPRGAVLNRDLVTKLGHQISGITSARPLGSSAGNAVRYLKYEISIVPADMGEADAKDHLLERIDHFVRDRIVFASKVISNQVVGKMKQHGEVILTYARSSCVEQAILEAWKKGKQFEVICVGGETFDEGKQLLSSLLSYGIPTSYAPFDSLFAVLPRVTMVLLGTASLMSNGSLYSRAGTATVAMMAHHKKVPVIVCCETYKFSERVRLEGVGGNEQADPSPLLSPSSDTTSAGANLSALNLLYDLTPHRYVTAIASEAGLSGPESVAILLRDYKSILFGSS